MQRFACPTIIAIGLAVCGTGTACGEESQPAPSSRLNRWSGCTRRESTISAIVSTPSTRFHPPAKGMRRRYRYRLHITSARPAANSPRLITAFT